MTNGQHDKKRERGKIPRETRGGGEKYARSGRKRYSEKERQREDGEWSIVNQQTYKRVVRSPGLPDNHTTSDWLVSCLNSSASGPVVSRESARGATRRSSVALLLNSH